MENAIQEQNLDYEAMMYEFLLQVEKEAEKLENEVNQENESESKPAEQVKKKGRKKKK